MEAEEEVEKKIWHSDLFQTEAGFVSIYDESTDPESDDFEKEYTWQEYYVDTD